MDIVKKRERSLQEWKNKEQKTYVIEEVNTSEVQECWFQIKRSENVEQRVKTPAYQYSTL